MKWDEISGTRIAGVLLVFSGVFALVTEIAIAGGYFGGDYRVGVSFTDVHYLMINLVLLVAASTLLVGYYSRRNPVLLHGGLAVGSWLFAHVYWTVYVYLGGAPVTYPSVAELGFQGFHFFLIPVSLYLLRSAGIQLYRPSLLCIATLVCVPAVTSIWIALPVHQIVYSTCYLALIGGSILLGAHFLRHRHLPLFGAGLTLFSVTEGAYVGVTLFKRIVAVPYLDPLWYVGAAFIAFALFEYDDAGQLPDPNVGRADAAIDGTEARST